MLASVFWPAQNQNAPRSNAGVPRRPDRGMVMKKLLWLSAVVGILGFLRTTPTLAISVDFVPATQSVGVGQPVTGGCRHFWSDGRGATVSRRL